MGDMNAPLRVRTREGCRGGREQFQWNSIKEQDYKDREMYLGQSTKVGMMGKFGRYQVHDWYARKRDTASSIEDEKTSVQKYEDELMQEALGLKPKKLLLAKRQLSEEEIKEYLKRDDEKSIDKQGRTQMGPQAKIMRDEYGEEMATSNEDYVAQAAREAPIKGLGFAIHRSAKLEAIKAETFGTESQLEGAGSSSSSRVKIEAKEEVKDEVKTEHEQGGSGLAEVQVLGSVKQEPGQRKRGREGEGDTGKHKKDKKDKKDKKAKKADKKLKKLEKKLKKAAKKERKAAKLAKKDPDDSSSSSSSS